MRIVVNNIAANSGGALSILKSFYDFILQNDDAKKIEWIFLLNDKYIEETKNIRIIVMKEVKKKWVNRLFFDIYNGKKLISSLKPDVIFSMQNTITFGINLPQVLYMHQSIPFQNVKKFSFFREKERKLAMYQYIIGAIIKKSIKTADITIVQTKWIKEAVMEATGIKANSIIEVLPSFNIFTDLKINCSSFERHRFFYPASNSLYKNHQCIYDACNILNEEGITDYNIALTLMSHNSTQTSYNGNNNFSYLGQIPYNEVLKLYTTSTLVFPSYIETVGLPLLEARQFGTLILAADCPYSREVLYGYENAFFFNPFSPIELAKLMKMVMKSEIEKKNIINNEIKITNGWNQVLNKIIDLAQ